MALQAAAHSERGFSSLFFFFFLGLAVSQFVKPEQLPARQSFFLGLREGGWSLLLNLQFRPDLLPRSERESAIRVEIVFRSSTVE